MDLIPTEYKFIGVGLLLAALFGWHVYDKHEAVDKAVDSAKTVLEASYQQRLNNAVKRASDASASLQATADVAKKEKDDKIKTLNSRINALNASLLSRPQRPSTPDGSVPASIGSTCTGAQLYREDGLFLTGEAARADKALLDRDYYYDQYEKARDKLKELNATTNP